MNIVCREWKANMRVTIFWSIGIICLLLMSFYKVQGMATTPGGMDSIMKSLPPVIQALFGSTTTAGTGIGTYQMIHLYMSIALALHAVILGATIFSKEERDKTFEFLYVKAINRNRILCAKMMASLSILFVILLVLILGVYVATSVVFYTLAFQDFLPYVLSLGMIQIFFYSLSLLLSVWMRNNQKVAMIGSCVVFFMFMVTIYVKIGGSAGIFETLSVFHYADASYLSDHNVGYIPCMLIIGISILGFFVSGILHNRRDLLN